MSSVFGVLLLLLALTAAQDDNDNWPTTVLRCERNDPNYHRCLLVRANRALDFVFEGYPALGVPKISFYEVYNITLGQNQTYKIHFNKATINGLEHLYVIGMNWDLQNQKVSINFKYNTAIFISGRYQSIGTLEDRDVNGQGKIDLVFVGGSSGGFLNYTMNYDLLKIKNHDYAQIKDSQCNVAEQGLRFNYNNELNSGDNNELINFVTNNTNVQEALLSECAAIFCSIVSKILYPFLYNFPLDVIFP